MSRRLHQPFATRAGRGLRTHAGELALVAGLALAIAPALAARGASTGPAGGEAPAILGRALAGLGGEEAVSRHTTWLTSGRGRENLSAELQGIDPSRPTWRNHEEAIAIDARTLATAWERKTPRNDLSLRWRRFLSGRDSSGFYDWNAGFGRMRAAPVPEAERRALARRIPHLLLLEAAHAGAMARGIGRVDGTPCDLVDFDADGTPITLAIGRDDARLHRARYLLDFPGLGSVPVDWEWPEWRTDARLGAVPRGHRVRVNGVVYQEVREEVYAADSSAARDLLGLPPNRDDGSTGAIGRGATQFPAGGEVAPGVHVIEAGNFNVLWVEFRDFVVAMEAPENHPGLEGIPAARDASSPTAAFLAAIHAATPKPVRFVILSHHHDDHMGGARRFADAGATLLVAPGHRRAALAACGGAPSPKIEIVASHRTITDGVRTLEVWNVGANPHTGENLFAWLPKERVLFQGDLFYFQQGGEFPPSGRATMDRFFAGWLAAHGLAPDAIYGVHQGGAAGASEIAAMREGPARAAP